VDINTYQKRKRVPIKRGIIRVQRDRLPIEDKASHELPTQDETWKKTWEGDNTPDVN